MSRRRALRELVKFVPSEKGRGMISDSRSDNQNFSKTLLRGLQVVELMAEAGAVGVAELSRRLRLSKTVAHRLLSTLEARGYVRQDPVTNKYGLTFRLFMIGTSVPQRLGLQECAQPVLERLVAETDETADLGVLDDIYMIYIQKVESPEPLRIGVSVGMRVPAFVPRWARPSWHFSRSNGLKTLSAKRTSNPERRVRSAVPRFSNGSC